MDARLNYQDSAVATKFAKYLISAGKVVSGSALPTATQHLVEIRASQINGCAYCTDIGSRHPTLLGGAGCRCRARRANSRGGLVAPATLGSLWCPPNIGISGQLTLIMTG